MTSSQKPDGERRLIDWIIAALGIILAVLLFLLVREYQTLRHTSFINAINARESSLTAALQDHHHLTPSDADVIRTWMTFDYLNKLFALPPDYLKTQLGVTDASYPKLTISKFARDIGQPASSTLMEVQNAVGQYLTNPLPANASST
jgi:hypothetical protein